MSVKNTQKLKAAKTRLAKAEIKVTELKRDLAATQQEYNQSLAIMVGLKKEIAELSSDGLVVSEHAILRFLEKAMGFDMEQIKDRILSENVITMAANLVNGKYPIEEGLKAELYIKGGHERNNSAIIQ